MTCGYIALSWEICLEVYYYLDLMCNFPDEDVNRKPPLELLRSLFLS